MIVITESFTDIYGEGETLEEAIADLASSLVEYREMLTESREALSDRLAGHLRHLVGTG